MEQASKTYSVVLNNIDENDRYTKKNSNANSMIYADYLTNGDVWEKQSLNETIWNNMVITSKEKKSADKNMKSIKSLPEVESKNELISLSDLIEDTNDTKITEFENPLLANMNLDDHKINQCNDKIRSYKKKQNCKDFDNSTMKLELNNLFAKHEPNNIVIHQDPAFIIEDPQLNNELVNQGNNNGIINYNNYVESSGNIKATDIEIPLIQDVEMINNNNNETSQIEQIAELVPSSNEYFAIIQNPNELALQIESNKAENSELMQNQIITDQFIANQNQNNSNNRNVTKKPKVTILSETTISDPVIVEGHLEPVSPSVFIHLPKKKNKRFTSDFEMKHENNEMKTESNNDICEEFKYKENLPVKEVIMSTENNKTPESRNYKHNENSSKSPVVKYKIAPERVAAIEQKRNFNKKLRDIIEVCLDKLDDQDSKPSIEDFKVNRSRKVKDPKNKAKCMNQNVGTYLSKEPELPDAQDYMMKYLDAKMKTMQNVLLTKIERNSERIVELKNLVTNKPMENKSTGTQISFSEESYKRQLYQEISKFLSPNANSLVYEELFINKYGQELPNQIHLPKRRKCR